MPILLLLAFTLYAELITAGVAAAKHGLFWTLIVCRELRSGQAKCRDGIIIVWLGFVVIEAAVQSFYWTFHTWHPWLYCASGAVVLLYGLAGTVHTTGVLEERQRWLTSVQPPQDERRN